MIFLFKVSFIPILEMWTWGRLRMCPGALPTVVCKPGSVLIVCPWLSSLAQTRGFSFWPSDLMTPHFISVLHTPYPRAAWESGLLVPNTALLFDTACPGQLLSPARPQHTLPQDPERRFPSDLSSGKAGIPWGKCFCLCVIVFSLRTLGLM